MLRRRHRLVTICAVAIVFLLYRAARSPWDWQPDAEQPSRPKQPSTPAHSKASKSKAPPQPETADEPLRWKSPPKGLVLDTRPSPSKIHWTKPYEHFPLPKESVVTLPTGKAKPIPKIQHSFTPESLKAKETRLQRQSRVKAELERAWAGYKKYAWNHDELSPVSARYRDPFCGWAATLVDSLDTLWIAGMKEAFDEAAQAVKDIDFTYTKRPNIPVFETTIRYLGGLIAAYDVSGGAQGSHSFLLDKAIQLAEILMGIFDTPNRMPILFYQWMPQFTSQPHMAGHSGIAELGTLSMEFTRLAQLTGQHKYYDAVDRITNALVDFQKRGSLVPGLFPESLDTSGCNRTATLVRDSMSQAARQQSDSQEVLAEPQGYGGASGNINSVLDKNRQEQRPSSADDRLHRRTDTRQGPDGDRASTSPRFTASKQESPTGPLAANGQKAPWDCVPQGLVPAGFGSETYHVGGSQDSAYEYFPKEYLLLGGREPKYKKLYEDSIDAINKRLLFRPMASDGWDVLFPAKITTRGGPEANVYTEYEVTHLTCFVGGMYGLGGKLFGRDEDLETAKKLTDGCVWAYQMMPSGIMPEHAVVEACPSLDKCEFNETQWYDSLDPAKSWREEQLQMWIEAQEELRRSPKEPAKARTSPKESSREGLQKRAAVSGETKGSAPADEGSELPQSLREKLGMADAKSAAGGSAGKGAAKSSGWPDGDDDAQDTDYAGSVPTIPKQQAGRLKPSDVDDAEPPSARPQSHSEWVQQKLALEKLPRGFKAIQSPKYILRPEAIESVWYMYRITGDAGWMDKGWAMFEATVRATRTAHANSAIGSVLDEQPALLDEMESFWIAETLKYYFLLFAEPAVISLDEWVLNTEAHPFRL